MPVAPTEPQNPAETLQRLIAQVQPEPLRDFLKQNPDWQALQARGFTAWTRVLVDKKSKRQRLLEILLEKGLDPDRAVVYKGKQRLPISLAIQHGRAGVLLRLLEAGAKAGFTFKKRSPLSVFTENFEKSPLDLRGRVVEKADQKVLEQWQKRLLDAGARPSPEFMADCYRRAQPVDSCYRQWLIQWWDKGLRPIAPPTIEGQELGPTYEVLRLALQTTDQQPLDWLKKAIQERPLSPAWLSLAAGRVDSLPSPVRLSQVVERVEKATVHQNWSNAWSVNARNAFESAVVGNRSSYAMKRELHYTLLLWALDNGLPADSLVSGRRPFAKPFLTGSSPTKLTWAVLQKIADAGFSLDSVLGSESGPQVQTIEQFLAEKNAGFWSVPTNAARARQIFLDSRLSRPMGHAAPKVRL